jgi:hypothetical protein
MMDAASSAEIAMTTKRDRGGILIAPFIYTVIPSSLSFEKAANDARGYFLYGKDPTFEERGSLQISEVREKQVWLSTRLDREGKDA